MKVVCAVRSIATVLLVLAAWADLKVGPYQARLAAAGPRSVRADGDRHSAPVSSVGARSRPVSSVAAWADLKVGPYEIAPVSAADLQMGLAELPDPVGAHSAPVPSVGASASVPFVGADLQVGPESAPAQTEEDDYTRYELLAPDTQQFAIVYDVTATTAGARYYFNPIRPGSDATDERVIDLMTGESLKFDVVSGAEARQGGHPRAAAETSYIRIHLPRPVPKDGEVRLRIWKTYKDPKSYYRQDDLIVFDRSLGIRRNAVVLPPGYELVSCNVPSQVLREDDGRTKVSFMNTGAAAAPLVVRARARREAGSAAIATPPAFRSRLAERAFQDREIVYFLQPPETNSFSLYHDYTESREGVDKYLNVVRAGSSVSNPSARLLDTGESLRTEILKGAAITAAKIDIGEPVRPETEVVVIHFPPVKKGQSVRLRISETYTDRERYHLDGDTLVWDRAFGRPRNTVVLPAGWSLVDSAIPAVVSETDDGRVRLYFENNRPDEIATLIRARRR